MRAERVGRATLLAQIVAMVGQAAQPRADSAARGRRALDILFRLLPPRPSSPFAVWMMAGPEPLLPRLAECRGGF